MNTQYQLKPIPSVGLLQEVARYHSLKLSKDQELIARRVAASMIDLTTLTGSDTPAVIQKLCRRARFAYQGPHFDYSEDTPVYHHQSRDPNDYHHTAAVCVYPRFVKLAVDTLQKIEEKLTGEERRVRVAAVATYFPSGQVSDQRRLDDIQDALNDGADEIDIVINRGEFLCGHYLAVKDEVRQAKELCGDRTLKVILETGELKTLENIYLASQIAIDGGADFIKTSTGMVKPGATLPAALVMMHVVREHHRLTGKKIGIKPAGGIRNPGQALAYLSMLAQTLGSQWMTPKLFRFGASSLLDQLKL